MIEFGNLEEDQEDKQQNWKSELHEKRLQLIQGIVINP